MVKKTLKYSFGILGVGAILLLIFYNLTSFVTTTNRLKEILDINNLKNCFELYIQNNNLIFEESINEIKDGVEGVIDSIESASNKTFGDFIISLLEFVFDFFFNFTLYFCNYGLNIILILYLSMHQTLVGTNLNIKTSPLAHFYIKLTNIITSLINKLISQIKALINVLYNWRAYIAFFIFLSLLANGFIYRFAVEFIIFIITYVIKLVSLETYKIVFDILTAIFIFIYPKLKYIPSFIFIPLFIILLFVTAINKAEYRLKKNHDRLKKFTKEELTQTTFINGPPGTGKTLLNVSLTLAAEENFINELENKLLEYELKYKYLNFAKVRSNPEEYPEHKEYAETYKLLTTRKSFIISNFAIFSPLFNDYSKIFNFDYMRVNKPTEYYPLEEYIITSISEFDKEYNSHDNKKEVGEDGAATFFSTISHDLKRHTKIFVDYQLKDQVPLRIRGNAEYFIKIKERKKKYPILLLLYYAPFILLDKITKYLIKKYEQINKTIAKRSNRKGVSEYKRNDYTLLYAMLRSFAYNIQKIKTFFDQYYYFKLTVYLTQEGDDSKGIKRNLCINIRDLEFNKQKLYDSTFLSFSYEQKKNKDFKDLDKFTKLAPSKDELNMCNSRFYNKINS